MVEAKDPLTRAGNHLMDAGEWGSARDLYRTAFTRGLPDPPVFVGNLRHAETYDRVAYWEQLRERYPQSPDVLANFIIVLTEARQPRRIVALCTDLLAALEQAPWDARWLSVRRFWAALDVDPRLAGPPYAALAEDFLRIWADRGTRQALQDLARVRDPRWIPQLALLRDAEALPPVVREFVAAKIRELEALSTAMAALEG